MVYYRYYLCLDLCNKMHIWWFQSNSVFHIDHEKILKVDQEQCRKQPHRFLFKIKIFEMRYERPCVYHHSTLSSSSKNSQSYITFQYFLFWSTNNSRPLSHFYKKLWRVTSCQKWRFLHILDDSQNPNGSLFWNKNFMVSRTH